MQGLNFYLMLLAKFQAFFELLTISIAFEIIHYLIAQTAISQRHYIKQDSFSTLDMVNHRAMYRLSVYEIRMDSTQLKGEKNYILVLFCLVPKILWSSLANIISIFRLLMKVVFRKCYTPQSNIVQIIRIFTIKCNL
ncbi:hypothetical protein FGO68_gene1644 [Halteria grandinella]|uniref:Uncharacterized protein n=1 Tax=Halteria grandinella TaxID=5974 RepID=A0A8J8T5L1_HALGN|nr:hypothetical protein FGO68_gene1644 [Halteria grandinella]